jgi:molybdopterin molybdotransferase
MLTVEEALETILKEIAPLETVEVPLKDATEYVLAQDLFADIDNPPFDNSAVDGYAVMWEDTQLASPDSPVYLMEVGEVHAGGVAQRSLQRGQCMRVMTGAPIPEGANAMVMVEDTHRDLRGVAVTAPARHGDHIRRRGEDVRIGAHLLSPGTVISSSEAAMLAAMGCSAPRCYRRPKVAVLSTGDELVDPSVKPKLGQIRDCNRFALAALVAEAGGDLHSIEHLPDDAAQTLARFRACAGLDGSEPADVIVTSGGVSVGDRDYVKPALESLGTLQMWRVRMKPGKPVAYGQIGQTHFFGLPGNPVSTMVTFELFVRPALWKLSGRKHLHRQVISARLNGEVRRKAGRREYIRATVHWRERMFEATPTGKQGSGILSSMLGANGLVVIPEEASHIAAGTELPVILLSLPASDVSH